MLFVFVSAPISAATPPSSSQLESGYINNIEVKGKCNQIVPGKSVLAVGTKHMPWRFCFTDFKTGEELDSYVLASAFIRTPETDKFGKEWDSSIKGYI